MLATDPFVIETCSGYFSSHAPLYVWADYLTPKLVQTLTATDGLAKPASKLALT